MKSLLLFTFAAAAVSFAAGPAPAPAPAAGEGFKAYKSTRVRNIFDPARMRDPSSDGAPPPRTEPGKTPFFALTGTMIRPDKSLGFFTGSSSEMNRVITAGETIGGYKIRTVSVEGAELEKDGANVTLPVGRQIPLEGRNANTVQPFAPEPPPAPADAPALPPPSTTGSRPPGSPPSSSSEARDRSKLEKYERRMDRPPKGASEELIRKMMERAQKERSSK